jgi:hypothetical protein
MSAASDRWFDQEAGPVVRPYAVTRGRTRPASKAFDLIAVVAATGEQPAGAGWLGPEQRHILDLCREPVTVADLASGLDLPLGVVRVLLSDLSDQRLVTVLSAPPVGRVSDVNVLRNVLDGLKAL